MATKYFIYRILVIKKDGTRRSMRVKAYSESLETTRETFRKAHDAERVYLTYNERMD